MSSLAFFLLLNFSVFWRIITINFFHNFFCKLRNYVKIPKIQYDEKETQHGLQLINDGVSIQIELSLSIVEIQQINILKVKKIPILKVSWILCSCYLPIEYTFPHAFTSDPLCPGFLRVFYVALGLIQKRIVKVLSS